MWIKSLCLKNFRNYDLLDVCFDKGINVFYGENAQGKTNIIEAIYLCALGKSFRAKRDTEMINITQKNASVEVEFQKADRSAKVKVLLSNKKVAFLNGVKLKRLSELISNLNVVIFTPDDIGILKGDPRNRRRFLDIMIGQLRPSYVFALRDYEKVLGQRNACLKLIRDEGKSPDLLDVWDEKLAFLAKKIFDYRLEFMERISSFIGGIHLGLTDGKEDISIKYVSDFSDVSSFLELLRSRRRLDVLRGFSSKGVHRDDFSVFVNGSDVSVYGSQGQNRTAVLSLKLAELEVVKDDIDDSPVLLLDDFMSELDRGRVNNFLDRIGDVQVFITCTEPLEVEKNNFFIYNIKDGKIFK